MAASANTSCYVLKKKETGQNRNILWYVFKKKKDSLIPNLSLITEELRLVVNVSATGTHLIAEMHGCGADILQKLNGHSMVIE
jgi:hypothetical protein